MLLSTLIFLPVLGALLLCLFKKEEIIRPAALGVAIAEFILSLKLLAGFDKTSSALQFVERTPWIRSFGVDYFLGLDGISLWLVILTTFLTPLIILASWNSIDQKVRGFHINLLFLQSAMVGTFLAMDAVLFYVFFEASLVPMYFIVGIWGGTRRIYATIKFFIYTMIGSVLMLVAILAMILMTEQQLGQMSASILDFYKLNIPFSSGYFLSAQTLMFFAFSLAFAIKVPMFPLHTWLPDAHVEAPTAGSVILAGVMLKMGTYGFMRFAIPLFPEATQEWAWLFMTLAVLGIVYGALVAMVQPDMKKLVAYSSVSHMGYVVLGLFALNHYGIQGAYYQMLNHGISTGALFLLVGMIYERTHSREIDKYGGLAAVMPVFATAFFIVTLSSIAVPGTNGFVGEFLILLGAFVSNKFYGAIAALGVVFGASYMLWMYKKVFFGPRGELVVGGAEEEEHGHHGHSQTSSHSKNDHHGHALADLNFREVAILVPLIVLVFWMGIYPKAFLDYSKASIDHLSANKLNYQLSISSELDSDALLAQKRGDSQ